MLSRGRNNGWPTDMTGQILPLACGDVPVTTEMASHIFLEQLEKTSLETP